MVLLSSNTTKSPHQAHNKISRRRGRRRQLQHVTLRLQGLSGWRVAGPGRAYFRKMAQITGLRTASLPFLEGDVTELCCRFVNYPGTTIISPTALRLLPAPFVLLLSSAESSRQLGGGGFLREDATNSRNNLVHLRAESRTDLETRHDKLVPIKRVSSRCMCTKGN